MMKMECDVCKYQSATPSDFCRVFIRRYRTFNINDLHNQGTIETKDVCYSCCQKVFAFDVKSPLTDETDIADLELSVRAYHCLKRAGYNTYGDIKNLTVEDGMKIRNLGKKAFDEVMQKIKDIEVSKNEN